MEAICWKNDRKKFLLWTLLTVQSQQWQLADVWRRTDTVPEIIQIAARYIRCYWICRTLIITGWKQRRLRARDFAAFKQREHMIARRLTGHPASPRSSRFATSSHIVPAASDMSTVKSPSYFCENAGSLSATRTFATWRRISGSWRCTHRSFGAAGELPGIIRLPVMSRDAGHVPQKGSRTLPL